MSSGDKYRRTVRGIARNTDAVTADVYCILEAFGVTCSARAHAIKKLLCTGDRGKADALTDLIEAKDAVDRAITLQWQRNNRMALYRKGTGSDRTQPPKPFWSAGSADLAEPVVPIGGAVGSDAAASMAQAEIPTIVIRDEEF